MDVLSSDGTTAPCYGSDKVVELQMRDTQTGGHDALANADCHTLAYIGTPGLIRSFAFFD